MFVCYLNCKKILARESVISLLVKSFSFIETFSKLFSSCLLILEWCCAANIGHAMVSWDSSWRVALRDVRWVDKLFSFSLHLKFSDIVDYCQVIVSGKLRAARAKSMKFKDGYMVSSGQPTKDYIDSAVRHVLLRQVRVPSPSNV